MTPRRALFVATSLLTLFSAHAFAQDATPAPTGAAPPATPTLTDDAKSLPAETAKSDIKYVLAGGYAHFFDTDFDSGGGTVEVDRAFASLDLSSAPNDDYSWELGFAWEGSWYGFDDGGALASAAGGTPWNDVQSMLIAPGATFKLDDHWHLNLQALVQFAGESDADAFDSAAYGGVAVATYAFSKELVLGGGVLAISRIEDTTLIVPQFIVNWQPCEEFRLSNFAGPEAFPGGAGLEAIWVLSGEYELALGGRYTYRRFRLSDDASTANGIGTDEGLPLWLRATMHAKCGARLDLVGGIQLGGVMELDDSHGHQLASVDVEPAPFLGVFFSWTY